MSEKRNGEDILCKLSVHLSQLSEVYRQECRSWAEKEKELRSELNLRKEEVKQLKEKLNKIQGITETKENTEQNKIRRACLICGSPARIERLLCKICGDKQQIYWSFVREMGYTHEFGKPCPKHNKPSPLTGQKCKKCYHFLIKKYWDTPNVKNMHRREQSGFDSRYRRDTFRQSTL